MTLLDSAREEFTERNVPLCLLLGLISLARRLDGLVAIEHAREQPREQKDDDAFIYLILGLISLKKTLLSELEPIRAAARRRDRGAPESSSPSSPLHDLLR